MTNISVSFQDNSPKLVAPNSSQSTKACCPFGSQSEAPRPSIPQLRQARSGIYLPLLKPLSHRVGEIETSTKGLRNTASIKPMYEWKFVKIYNSIS